MSFVCFVLDEHNAAEAAGAQRLQPLELLQGSCVLKHQKVLVQVNNMSMFMSMSM